MEDNNNNLEKFFRDKFNQKIEPQDWNIPDNEVWDGIASIIPAENKRRRFGILPLIFVGGLAVMSLILGYDNYKKGRNIAELRQELNECSNQTSVSNNENNPSEKFIGESAKLSNNYQNNERNLSYDINKIVDLPQNGPVNHRITRKTRRSKFNQSQKSSSSTAEIYTNSIMDEKNPFEQGTDFKNNEFITISSLPALPYAIVNRPNTLPVIDFPLITDYTKPIKQSSGRMLIGPVLGYINWQDKIKGSFDNPLSELLTKEETSPSLAMGLAFSKTVGSHLVLNTGILYYQRNQSSQYAINLPYSTTNEISVGSEFENRFEHSLPTGLGNINTSLVLSRSINSPVSNNENVYLDFSLQNHTKALAIPLTMSYYLTKAGAGFFVQGGIMNEFIIENKIREVNTESHHTFVRDKSIVVDYNASQINKLNVSTIVGIGYEKEIFKGIGVSLLANYGFALTNTFATPDYQHKIDQLGIQMMFVKTID